MKCGVTILPGRIQYNLNTLRLVGKSTYLRKFTNPSSKEGENELTLYNVFCGLCDAINFKRHHYEPLREKKKLPIIILRYDDMMHPDFRVVKL